MESLHIAHVMAQTVVGALTVLMVGLLAREFGGGQRMLRPAVLQRPFSRARLYPIGRSRVGGNPSMGPVRNDPICTSADSRKRE